MSRLDHDLSFVLNLCSQLVARLQNGGEAEMLKLASAWKDYIAAFQVTLPGTAKAADFLEGYAFCHWTQLRALLCHNPYYIEELKKHITDLFCPITFLKDVERSISLFLRSVTEGLDDWKSKKDFPDSELLEAIKRDLENQDVRAVISNARERAALDLGNMAWWPAGAEKPFKVNRMKDRLRNWWSGVTSEDLKNQVLKNFCEKVQQDCKAMLQTSLIMQIQAPRGGIDLRVQAIVKALSFEDSDPASHSKHNEDLSEALARLSETEIDGELLTWLNCTAFNRKVVFQTGEAYVFSNPSMPGLFKIGQTKGSSTKRGARGSSSTWIPSPFKLEYKFSSRAPFLLEQAMHHVFDKMRWSADREFFTVPRSIIILVGDLINKDIENRAKKGDHTRFRLFTDEAKVKKSK